jgi:hypothetical protein
MGFGLLALGYIFLNFYTTGADLVGYVIMLFALNKLTKIEKSFKKSMIAVILLIPVGLFNVFGFVDTVFKLGIFRNYDYQIPTVSVESGSDEQSDVSSLYSSGSDENENTSEGASEKSTEDVESTESENSTNDKRKKFVNLSEGIFNAIFIFGALCFHYFFYQSARKLCAKTGAVKLGFNAYRNMAVNIVFFSVWGLMTAGGVNMAVLNIVTLLHFPVLIFNFIYIYSCYATFAFEGDSEDDEKDK